MERLDFKVPRLTDCCEIIENDIKKQSTVKEDCRVGTLASLNSEYWKIIIALNPPFSDKSFSIIFKFG